MAAATVEEVLPWKLEKTWHPDARQSMGPIFSAAPLPRLAAAAVCAAVVTALLLFEANHLARMTLLLFEAK